MCVYYMCVSDTSETKQLSGHCYNIATFNVQLMTVQSY